MSKLVLNGDVSGSVTLDAPAVSGTTILTLPTTSGTVLTSASSVAASQLPVGSVLQVVQGTLNTEISRSSSAFADTGLTASITPSSTSNKILVISQLNACGKQSGNTWLGIKLMRGSTDIQIIDSLAGYTNNTTANWIGSISSTYLDSPSTTSSTTYKLQYSSQGNVASIFINGNSSGLVPVSTITLLEIKG